MRIVESIFRGGRALGMVAGLSLVAAAGAETAWAQVIPSAPRNVAVYAGGITTPAVSVRVSPATVTIQPGEIVQFSAAVTGTSNTWVLWSAIGNTVNAAGTYTAGQATGTFTVTATLSGGTISGSAVISVEALGNYVNINPGEDIMSRVNAMPAGTSFRLRAGVHRLQTITPRNGDVFAGEPGAILSGARLLTTFTQSGQAWIASGQTQEGSLAGECRTEWPRCSRPEDLFIDNVMLKHVDSLAAGGPGRWYFDYAADRIYFWDDPAGRTVETGVTTWAFLGSAVNVTISNLIVEKYANPAQYGAIRGGGGWIVSDNEVRWNHGVGIGMANDRKVLRNNIHHNGQMGIGGSSSNGLVEGNEIAYNNVAGFNPYWEAGATKFTYSNDLMVRNNFVHHNYGLGLWTDIDNVDITYEYNRVEDNTETGISHEISYAAVIRYNIVKRNGSDRPWPYWVEGAGILVSNSSDVEVYGNTLEDNWQGIFGIDLVRGSGGYGPWTLTNLYVHDNIVKSVMPLGAGSGRSGVGAIDLSAYTSKNNRFDRNTYALGPYDRYFSWMGSDVTEAEWVGYGQDYNGTFTR